MNTARTKSCVLTLAVVLAGLIPGRAPAEPAGPALVPGLIGRYSCNALGNEPALVRIDPGVAFDWSDGMPDDRLPDGDFQVAWEGLVRIPYSGRYRFTARAQGAARIWVDRREVFPLRPDDAEAAAPLEAGEHAIRIEYDAPAGGARIHLVWSSDSIAPEVINPRYLLHQGEAEGPVADRLIQQRGREVVQRYGCARCHPIVGVDRSRKPGLPMPHVAHMNPDWVARWVRNPQSVRPGTRMGAPGGTPEEIEVAATSLLLLVQLCDSYGMIDSRWRCGQETDPLDRTDLDELVRAGRVRFYELGCSACHAPETPELVDPAGRGPSLADIGSKWSKAYLRQLMLDPVSRHPTGGMPGYKLEALDVDRLVAYMSTFLLKRQPGDSAETLTAWPQPPQLELRPEQSLFDPDVLASLKAPIRGRFCYACHSTENTPVDGPELDPATARWTAGCLRSDRGASIAPQFTLTPADRAAVIAFLSGRPAEASSVASEEVGRRFIDQTLYCFACHKRDGQGGEPLVRTLAHYRPGPTPGKPDPLLPPDLSGVGTRLVRSWMLETLAGKSPSNRPWLEVKMPDYGLSEAERSGIAARLATADEIPDLAAPREQEISRPFEATAAALTGAEGFGCLNCHFLGETAYEPGGSAPDFTLATRRVSRAWFHRWLLNPSRIMPETPMPTFAAPVSGIAGDDLATQKEIIWRYLQKQAAGTPPTLK